MPGPTLVNDGAIYVALGIWAGWTAAASDPTLPLGAALAVAVWKLYDKRNKRNPGGSLCARRGGSAWAQCGYRLCEAVACLLNRG